MWRHRLLAVACTALAGCGSAAPTGGERVVTILQDDAVFLHRSDHETARSMDALKALGVDWLRITAGWSVIAPEPDSGERPAFDERDPGAYPRGAWRRLDRAVRLARERGLRVNVDIAFWAPRWAVARGLGTDGRERWGIDAAAYGRFAEAVARRYPDAAAFTVWNEPNHNVFLMPQWDGERAVSPHVYREMLYAAVPAIRRVAPNALVLIGATSSIGARGPRSPGDRMPPLRFLRELACVEDAGVPECRDFRPLPGDGWSHHPYSNELAPDEPDPFADNARMADLDRLSSLLASLHAAGRLEERLPLYLTEYGYQTNPPDPTRPYSPADQARFVAAAERIARSRPDVRSTAQFLLRDLPARRGRSDRVRWRDYQSGLRFQDGSPKPAERAFAYPLVVSGGEVWGLVRPGRGPRKIVLRVDGEPRALTTAPDGTFTARVPAGARVELRLSAPAGSDRARTPAAAARPRDASG